MIKVLIADQFKQKISPRILEDAALAALRHVKAPSGISATIVIEDDDKLRELNKSFRGIDSATDILSFPSSDIDPETNMTYLGDVIISFPLARTHAFIAGHSCNDELRLLVVHGILHLYGYNHSSIEEKSKMWSTQNEILGILGCNLSKMPGK